jgi:hypothetical protein
VLWIVEDIGLIESNQHIRLHSCIDMRWYEKVFKAFTEKSHLAQRIPKLHREWHLPFGILYKVVKTGRNDALHQGAFARHLTDHAIQLALVLEDTLMVNLTRVSDYRVRDPVHAHPWQPLSFVRQQMLASSFSYLPIWYTLEGKEKWCLLSDYSVARYLRAAPFEQRNKRLATSVEKAHQSGSLHIEEAVPCPADDEIDKAMTRFRDGKPLLVIDRSHEKNLLGILTPFDLL